MKIRLFLALLLTSFLSLTGCGAFNGVQVRESNVEAAEAKMLSVAQQRVDLVDNAVATVRAYAGHERSVFAEVAVARSSAGQVNVKDPAAMQEFLNSQAQLATAMPRLMAVAEAYPQLKADQGFLQLQRDLNRMNREVNKARQAYIEAISSYNKAISVFPNNLLASLFGWEKKPQYKVMEESASRLAPKVGFDAGPSSTFSAPKE